MTHGNTDSTGPAHDNVAGLRAVPVPVRRLDTGLPLPVYAHAGDAGADLYSRVDVTLAPGERFLVPTGLALELPEGYAAFTHPRSGLAARHGISLVNAPGTIDAGYRGEILVNLVNLDARESFVVRRGDRIAQMVVQRVERAQFLEVDSLASSERGETGHGASGGFLSNRADETADEATDEAVSETADPTADRTTDHRKG